MSDIEPLTPATCDLSDFQYMELDVRRLRDSKFSASATADSFRAAILLWCAAWHQVPAASLPDDDIELANLAGYGRVVKEWKKVRSGALHGFVKCSDGRLYHPVIAEKALSAWAAKERHAFAKYLDRLRKENARREKEKKTPFGIPTVDQWKSGAYPHGIPPELQPESEQFPPEIAQKLTGIEIASDRKLQEVRSENALKGNREGTERERNREGEVIPSVTDVTDAGGVDPTALTKAELWTAGKSLLAQQGMPRAQCGTFVGRLVKDYGDQVVVEAVRAAVVTQPADAAEYLKATCMRAKGERKPDAPQESFAAQDAAAARQRWEQQTGRIHPDNLPQAGVVIDSTHRILEIAP